jgi:hypothetical protein
MEQRGIGEEGLQELLEVVLLNYQKVKEWDSKIKYKVQLALTQLARLNESYDPGIDDPIMEKLVKRAAYGVNSKEDEVVEEGIVEVFRQSEGHLDRFDKSKVNKGTPANAVNVQLRIDTNVVSVLEGEESGSLSDQTIENEMSSPKGSTDTVVINTQNDGEVSKLANALKMVTRFFRSFSGNKNVSFAVSLYGAWGACDGCKKRIERFVELWFSEATRVMKPGKRATLKVTYQYLNAPTIMKPEYGNNLYGWDGDPGKGPWFHTLEASVTGS